MENRAVQITVYRWAGHWGPFRVRIPCGECSLTKDVILDTLDNELEGIPVELEMRDWLSQWWKPLIKGGWHAPIVMVEGRVISQGHALNRGVLTQAVIESYDLKSTLEGNHLFGKSNCPHCVRAKGYLDNAAIDYQYHDVIHSPRALYEMLARVKPIVGPKTPITVPQIWIEGLYVGGADELSDIVAQPVEANPERGQCSISKKS
ncbi:glutaredoxin domain-containing protein [Dongshaea marina]|uniref:glutaredoxin domain-containing protein n=1 Tax=Dongshaea marina TaxID=2047966 RepID=UPI000D3E2E43|nr:glutaredoxin [Dongshaea marina]